MILLSENSFTKMQVTMLLNLKVMRHFLTVMRASPIAFGMLEIKLLKLRIGTQVINLIISLYLPEDSFQQLLKLVLEPHQLKIDCDN